MKGILDKNGIMPHCPLRSDIEEVINEHFTGADEYREEHRRDKERKNAVIANLSDRVLQTEEDNAHLRAQLEKTLADFGKVVTDKGGGEKTFTAGQIGVMLTAIATREAKGEILPAIINDEFEKLTGPNTVWFHPNSPEDNPVFACHAAGPKDLADSLYVNGPGRIGRPIPAACYDQPNPQVNHHFTGREPVSSMTVLQEVSSRIATGLAGIASPNGNPSGSPEEVCRRACLTTKLLFEAWQKEGWA